MGILRASSQVLLSPACSSHSSVPLLSSCETDIDDASASWFSSSISGCSTLSATSPAQDRNTTPAHLTCVGTIKMGGKGYVASLTATGRLLYVGSSCNDVRVFAIKSSKQDFGAIECAQFGRCDNGAVKAIVVAGNKVLTAHQDHKIRAWTIKSSSADDRRVVISRRKPVVVRNNMTMARMGMIISMKLVATIPTVMSYIMASINPRRALCVRVRRHHQRPWVEHVDTISCLAVSPATGLLYSASWDRSIKVWRLSDFRCVESITDAHDDAINAMIVSRCGKHVFTACGDGKLNTWGLKCLQKSHMLFRGGRRQRHFLVESLDAHKSGINALAWSTPLHHAHDVLLLYTGDTDGSIIAWEVRTSSKEEVEGAADVSIVFGSALRGHRNAILCLASSPLSSTCHNVTNAICNHHNSSIMCSGSADHTIRVWKREAFVTSCFHSCIALLQGHSSPVKCIAICSVLGSHEGAGMDADDHECQYDVYGGSLNDDIKVWRLCVGA